jgi:hypothetical protein
MVDLRVRLTVAPGTEQCWWRMEACCGGVGSICRLVLPAVVKVGGGGAEVH